MIRSLEPETSDVSARWLLKVRDLNVVQPVGDDLPDVLLWVDTGAVLVDVGEADRLANFEGSRISFLEPDDGFKQGRLTDAVWADNTDDAGSRQGKREVLDEDAIAESLGEMLGLQHDVAETRARRDIDFGGVDLAIALGLGSHLLIAGQAGLVLGLTGLGRGAHPFQLFLEDLGAFSVFLAFDLETLALGVQVRRVVALVGVQLAAIDLTDPLGDVIKEIAVVSDG